MLLVFIRTILNWKQERSYCLPNILQTPLLSLCKWSRSTEVLSEPLQAQGRQDLGEHHQHLVISLNSCITDYCGLGTVFRNLVFPLKHTRPCAAHSHSPTPPVVVWRGELGTQNGKVTGRDKRILLETAMR